MDGFREQPEKKGFRKSYEYAKEKEEMNADCMKTRTLLRWDASLREKTSFTGEDGKESARVRKGIPAGLPFFPTVETVCAARAKRLPEAGWVFFLRGEDLSLCFWKGVMDG